MIIAGIDYSMIYPAICVHDTQKPFTFENCQFYFRTPVKSLDGKIMPNVHGFRGKREDFADDIERFSTISAWAIAMLDGVNRVALEGYSMGSKGLVFNIGENTGILKHTMLRYGLEYEIYSPKEIKMFAINNSPLDFSNINKNKIQKEEIFSVFLEETRVNLQEILTPKKKKVDSPVSDIIDSYYICKLLRENLSDRGELSKTSSE